MPYIFEFKINHRIVFRAPLITKRCICDSSTGQRCNNKTVIGSPYCWIHLMNIKHLRIKESNIRNAGKGLFVMDRTAEDNAIIFHRGETIIFYHGEIINRDELERRYRNKTAPYGIQIYQNRFEDAALERGPGSLLNHTTEDNANCEFSISRNNKRNPNLNHLIYLKATKNIRNGQELLVSYGSDYRFNERGVEYRTYYGKL